MKICRMRVSVALCFLVHLLAAHPGQAETTLPAIFGNDMVLQRGEATPVWGKAPPGQSISVEFAGQIETTQADAAGRWKVELKDLVANSKGESLTVTGDRTVTFSNVLVGDVWLASGQSNMAMTVGKCEGREEAIEKSDDPLLRMFVVRPAGVSPLKPLDDCNGEWKTAGPDTVSGVSAAGYYFARRVRKDVGELPIGLIQSSWGGTLAEHWTSREALKSNPETKPLWNEFKQRVDAFDPATATPPEEVKKLMAEWRAKNVEARRNKTRIPKLPNVVGNPAGRRYSPCNQFNTMINPIIPFGLYGVVWYQGEGNRERAEQYETLLPVMIEDWRKRWMRPDAPFYIVQLANTGKSGDTTAEPVESVWAELQWAQFQVARTVPNSGLAVINDGEDTTLHPREKRKVGERLALWALARDYEKDDRAFSGPLYREAKIEGGKVRVYFDHADGLKSRDGQPLKHFQIAGEDKVWVTAEAVIDDETVVVSSPGVKEPVAVRYAWRPVPVGANLTNASDLPTSLFKTDDWPGLSAGKQVP